MLIVEVDSHVAGTPTPAPSLAPVTVHLQRNRITVAELIKRAVEAQVRELAIDRRLSPAVIRAILDSHYAAEPIGQQRLNDRINTRNEVKNALQAFAEQIFRVLIDDQLLTPELDRQVYLRPNSRISFVREIAA